MGDGVGLVAARDEADETTKIAIAVIIALLTAPSDQTTGEPSGAITVMHAVFGLARAL